MANETSGAYFTANAAVDKTAADKFIPEIWSDEVIASYEKQNITVGLPSFCPPPPPIAINSAASPDIPNFDEPPLSSSIKFCSI